MDTATTRNSEVLQNDNADQVNVTFSGVLLLLWNEYTFCEKIIISPILRMLSISWQTVS